MSVFRWDRKPYERAATRTRASSQATYQERRTPKLEASTRSTARSDQQRAAQKADRASARRRFFVGRRNDASRKLGRFQGNRRSEDRGEGGCRRVVRDEDDLFGQYGAFADATAAVARLRQRRIGVAFRRPRSLLPTAAATAACRLIARFRGRLRRARVTERTAAAVRTGDDRRDQSENEEPASHTSTVPARP